MINNENTDGTRQRILDSALKLFVEKGYAASSVSEIVKDANITKPMLYYYFKNKEGLYLEIMQQAVCGLESILSEYKQASKTSKEFILSFFCEVMRLQTENLNHSKLIYAMVFGPPQGSPFFDFTIFHNSIFSTVKSVIGTGVKNGEFTESANDDTVNLLLAALFFCTNSNVANSQEKAGIDDMRRMAELIIDKIMIKRNI